MTMAMTMGEIEAKRNQGPFSEAKGSAPYVFTSSATERHNSQEQPFWEERLNANHVQFVANSERARSRECHTASTSR
jgi:hypothetical protein